MRDPKIEAVENELQRKRHVLGVSFTISDTNDINQKKVTHVVHDPDHQYQQLMLVHFTLPESSPVALEKSFEYDEATQSWRCEIERHKDAREEFLIIPNVTPQDELSVKENASPIETGFLSLKNGEQQPVNKIPGVPAGELKKFLYTGDGRIEAPVDPSQLQEGERLIIIYFPPGYDSNREPPYDFQITLDGDQYIHEMQMNVVYDNLIAKKEMAPVVNVFISPYTGAPDPAKKGLHPVTPPGYSLDQRLREYPCNPTFADKLVGLRDECANQFNVTHDRERTTIWGLSMGGLQAEYTALTHPDVFGNVVAQSPMAWNIPTHRGENWREAITDDWTTATAELPEHEAHHEYITEMVEARFDVIAQKALDQSLPINFCFNSGKFEDKYLREEGFANLVKATDIFARSLESHGHRVLQNDVIPEGGHFPMTWMGEIATAATQKAKLQAEKDIGELLMWTNSSQDFLNAYSRYLSTITDDHQRTHLSNAFWKHLGESGGTPVIEDISGDDEHKKVTFYYQASESESTSKNLRVYLALRTNIDSTGMLIHKSGITENDRLKRVPGTNIYTLSIDLPDNVLSTYSFCITPPDGPNVFPEKNRYVRDEKNPQRFAHPDPGFRECSSILRMPNASENEYLLGSASSASSADKGKSISLHPMDAPIDVKYCQSQQEFKDSIMQWQKENERSDNILLINKPGEWRIFCKQSRAKIKDSGLLKTLDEAKEKTQSSAECAAQLQENEALKKEFHELLNLGTVYVPKGYPDEGPYPLILQLDGHAYQQIITDEMLNNMIEQEKIRPSVVVFLPPHPQGSRDDLYICNNKFNEFLATKLIPDLRDRFHCSAEAKDTFITGSSLGGLASFYAGLTYPEVFGNVISQSGALWHSREEIDQAVDQFMKEKGETCFTMDAGKFESGLFEPEKLSLLDANKQMAKKMENYPHYKFTDFPGGHDFLCWQATWSERLISAFELADNLEKSRGAVSVNETEAVRSPQDATSVQMLVLGAGFVAEHTKSETAAVEKQDVKTTPEFRK